MINQPFKLNYPFINRRKFIKSGLATAGIVLATPLIDKASKLVKTNETFTVKQVMDLFISGVPGGPLTETVDTLKAGSPDTVVTGIVTTMFATIEVIRKTIDLGANFIIAHEPTFYNHPDDTSWLQNDEVYRYKANLLKQHNIAVWRNHDYIHRLVPDGVTIGVLDQLDWHKYAGADFINLVTLPSVSLHDLVAHVKNKLNIEKVRFIGDKEQQCTRALLLPGAAGSRAHIAGMVKYKPDVLLCGEIAEWETAEYVRDARAKGDKTSLVVLGHIASEEPGSEYMLKWLKEKLPAIKSSHVPCGNSLSFM